jgi:NH3-dependent NAD+ synthetase
MTKYDCSSGDLNPIGSISKADLKLFLAWTATHYSLPVLKEVLQAPPTAELEPVTETYTQTDEAGTCSVCLHCGIHCLRHGHELRRVVCIRASTQGVALRPARNVR